MIVNEADEANEEIEEINATEVNGGTVPITDPVPYVIQCMEEMIYWNSGRQCSPGP